MLVSTSWLCSWAWLGVEFGEAVPASAGVALAGAGAGDWASPLVAAEAVGAWAAASSAASSGAGAAFCPEEEAAALPDLLRFPVTSPIAAGALAAPLAACGGANGVLTAIATATGWTAGLVVFAAVAGVVESVVAVSSLLFLSPDGDGFAESSVGAADWTWLGSATCVGGFVVAAAGCEAELGSFAVPTFVVVVF